MSTQQRNSACVVSVDPSTADVLRQQTLVVLEANHYFFEEILEFGPEAQHALSVVYRDAFAVLDAVGWGRPVEPPATVDVPFTAGFIEQLHRRRYDLGHTNVDRVQQESWDRTLVDRDREAAITLDRLLAQVEAERARAASSAARRVEPQPRPHADLDRSPVPLILVRTHDHQGTTQCLSALNPSLGCRVATQSATSASDGLEHPLCHRYEVHDVSGWSSLSEAPQLTWTPRGEASRMDQHRRP
jgi:hypothetical protein